MFCSYLEQDYLLKAKYVSRYRAKESLKYILIIFNYTLLLIITNTFI